MRMENKAADIQFLIKIKNRYVRWWCRAHKSQNV